MRGAWIDNTSYGTYAGGDDVEFASRTTLRKLGKDDDLFARPIKNYGRFAPVTQRVCCLTALALRDAGIDQGYAGTHNIGLLATDGHGSVEANRAFFQDYVDGGRTLSRASLFIYTLPSSPIAEASVHFGLTGPLLYLRPQLTGVAELLQTARALIAEGQAERMLVYELSDEAARCLVVEPHEERAEG